MPIGKALLNHSTTVPVEKSAADVTAILAKHHARKISTDYDASGAIVGLSWSVETSPGVLIPFKMPIDAQAVQKVLTAQYYKGGLGVTRAETSLDHGRMVAWRILKDWIESQMAIVETEMVTFEQVFLPYMETSKGRTLFDDAKAAGFRFKLLEAYESPYKILGVAEGETDKAKLRSAYIQKCKETHPDTGGTSADAKEFDKVQKAAEQLGVA